jgi:hypothetical protein
LDLSNNKKETTENKFENKNLWIPNRNEITIQQLSNQTIKKNECDLKKNQVLFSSYLQVIILLFTDLIVVIFKLKNSYKSLRI